LRDFEKEYSNSLLKKCQVNISKAAQLASNIALHDYTYSLHRPF